MLRKLLAAIACAVFSLGFTANLSASYVTSNATIQIRTDNPDPAQTGANPPLTEITQLGEGSGTIFTNQVNGTAFATGSTVRSVGSMPIVQAINGDNLPVTLPDGSSFQAIFAIEGTISAPGTATFTRGSIFLVSRTTDNTGGLSGDNPLTWNFDDVFAKFDLAAPDDILPGAAFGIEGGNIFKSAAVVNVSAAAGDGVFVFEEDSSFTPGANFDNPGLGTFVGDDFIRDVQRVGGPFFEGIAAITDQTIDAVSLGLTGPQIAALDAISQAAFGEDFSEGGYTPPGFGDPATGDFSGDLSSENYILTVVPEPSSLLLLGLGAGAMGCWYRRPRRQKIGHAV